MLTPFELDTIPNTIASLYSEYENISLNKLAKRINSIDYSLTSNQFRKLQMEQMQLVYQSSIQDMSRLFQVSEKEIEKVFKDATLKSLSFDNSIYKKAGLKVHELEESGTMLRIMKANIKKTKGNIRNLTLTTANTNQALFVESTNLAHLQIMSGNVTYDSAIKNAIKTASADGVTVLYPSGAKTSVESAVRRAITTSVNQTTGKIMEENIKQNKVELVQVSQHNGARPSHSAWQGGIYMVEGSSSYYENFEEATGYGTVTGLMGVNCKHSYYPFFHGISEKAIEDKERSVKHNGKYISEYEASQIQRYNERQIRKWKREESSLDAVSISSIREKEKVKHWQKKQRLFVKETGLRRDYSREFIG